MSSASMPALRHPNVTLLTGAYVERIETNATGREVSEVVVHRDGEVERYRGDIVVVACGAINSAALLLRSANWAHPDGLANGSGVVGRHYMCHNNSALIAISRTPNPTRFQKTLGLNDFYFGSDDHELPLGHIQMLGKTRCRDVPGRGAPSAARHRGGTMASHALDFWLTSEDLPDPDNRVLIDRDGGIRLHYRPNNLGAHEILTRKLRRPAEPYRLRAAPVAAERLFRQAPADRRLGHQNGTIRFGHDPQRVGARHELPGARGRQSLRRRRAASSRRARR